MPGLYARLPDNLEDCNVFLNLEIDTRIIEQSNKTERTHVRNIQGLYNEYKNSSISDITPLYTNKYLIDCIIYFYKSTCESKCPINDVCEVSIPPCLIQRISTRKNLSGDKHSKYIIPMSYLLFIIINDNRITIIILAPKRERVTRLLPAQQEILQNIQQSVQVVLTNGNEEWLGVFIVLLLLLDKVHDCDKRIRFECNRANHVKQIMETLWGNIIVIALYIVKIVGVPRELIFSLKKLIKYVVPLYKYANDKPAKYEDIISSIFIPNLFSMTIDSSPIRYIENSITSGTYNVNDNASGRNWGNNSKMNIGANIAYDGGTIVNSIQQTRYLGGFVDFKCGPLQIKERLDKDPDNNEYTESFDFTINGTTEHEQYNSKLTLKKHNREIFENEIAHNKININQEVKSFVDGFIYDNQQIPDDNLLQYSIKQSLSLFEKPLCDFGQIMAAMTAVDTKLTVANVSITNVNGTTITPESTFTIREALEENKNSVNCANDRLAVLIHMILLKYAPSCFNDSVALLTCPGQKSTYTNNLNVQNDMIYLNEEMSRNIQEILSPGLKIKRKNEISGGGGGSEVKEIVKTLLYEKIKTGVYDNLWIDILIYIQIIINNSDAAYDIQYYQEMKKQILEYLNNIDEYCSYNNIYEYDIGGNAEKETNEDEHVTIIQENVVDLALNVEEEKVEVEKEVVAEENVIDKEITNLLQTTIEDIAKDIEMNNDSSKYYSGYKSLFMLIANPGDGFVDSIPLEQQERQVKQVQLEKLVLLEKNTVVSNYPPLPPAAAAAAAAGGKNSTRRRTKNKRSKRTKITKKKHLKNAVTSRKVKRNGKKRIRKITHKKGKK